MTFQLHLIDIEILGLILPWRLPSTCKHADQINQDKKSLMLCPKMMIRFQGRRVSSLLFFCNCDTTSYNRGIWQCRCVPVLDPTQMHLCLHLISALKHQRLQDLRAAGLPYLFPPEQPSSSWKGFFDVYALLRLSILCAIVSRLLKNGVDTQCLPKIFSRRLRSRSLDS